MSRERFLPYVGKAIDERGKRRAWIYDQEIPEHARLVGWQCGFEPHFVAVWDDSGVRLDDQDAEEIVAAYLVETKWFSGEPTDCDYIV